MNYERPVRIPETKDSNTLNDRLKLLEYESTGLSPEQCESLYQLCKLYEELMITPDVLKWLLSLYKVIREDNAPKFILFENDSGNDRFIVDWMTSDYPHKTIITHYINKE